MKNEIDYKKFYDRVGSIIGWDFSNLHVTHEGKEWDFYDRVIEKIDPGTLLLDMGTGGGERVQKICGHVLFLFGIDLSESMIATAKRNMLTANIKNARFLVMNSLKLQFPDTIFDVVTCRHSEFNPKEVFRVVTDTGFFMTQQVSEGDKMNIKKAFGRGQSFGIPDGTKRDRYVKQLREAGFKDVQSFDYDATEWYERPEDVLFLLKHTPIIPNFGDDPDDIEIMGRFIADNQTEKGIKTNSKRYMIVAQGK